MNNKPAVKASTNKVRMAEEGIQELGIDLFRIRIPADWSRGGTHLYMSWPRQQHGRS